MASGELKRWIVSRAAALGFDLVGVSPVKPPAHGGAFADWLRRGYQGEMAYLSRTADRRLHPERYVPWASSVVSVGLNYNTRHQRTAGPAGLRGWISRYAWGDDYHDVVLGRLDRLLADVQTHAGPGIRGHACVDAAPVLDREMAARAGLGWFGKNTNLLSERIGSLFVLGEMFLSIPLETDRPLRDRCGQCRICLDACPTQAFAGPYDLDARRCISYLTIELKGAIPRDLRPAMGTHIFGCDICQDVCPYNTRCRPSAEPAYQPRQGLYEPELIPLLRLTAEEFGVRFRGSPILRAKRRGFLRNVCVALGNLGRADAVPALAGSLAGDPEPLVRAHAAWALGRIGGPDAATALREARLRDADPGVHAESEFALSASMVGSHLPNPNSQ
jgi:epoxyqueuosine reductase